MEYAEKMILYPVAQMYASTLSNKNIILIVMENAFIMEILAKKKNEKCHGDTTLCGSDKCLSQSSEPYYWDCDGECTHISKPCNGTCYVDTKPCGADLCLTDGNKHLYYECGEQCLNYKKPCNETCPSGTSLCGADL